jgi:hypothetical protein
LRELASRDNVECHGVLWVLDRMQEAGIPGILERKMQLKAAILPALEQLCQSLSDVTRTERPMMILAHGRRNSGAANGASSQRASRTLP